MRLLSKRNAVVLLCGGLVAAILAGLWWRAGREDRVDPHVACHVGVYRLDDGRLVDLAPVAGSGLRWRTMDGRTGRLQADGAAHWTGTIGWSDRPDAT